MSVQSVSVKTPVPNVPTTTSFATTNALVSDKVREDNSMIFILLAFLLRLYEVLLLFSACEGVDITQAGCVECQSKYQSWQTDVHAWILGPPSGDSGDRTLGCHRMCYYHFQKSTLLN